MSVIFRYLKNIFIPKPSLYVAFDSGGKNKQTIVLLHGIAATSKTWDMLINALGTNNYRIIALDLLGFGQSPKPLGYKYDVEDHIASVHKTLKKLKISKPFTIVGHSMGGIIASHYCTVYPNEIRNMYLLSLPIYLNDDISQTIIARTRTDLYLEAYKLLAEKKDFTITNSQLIRKILLIKDGIDVNEDNWNGFRLSLINTIVKQNTFYEIMDTKIPVCIVYGSLDEFLIQESINKLAALNKVNITKLDGVDHTIGKRFANELVKIIIRNK